MTGCGSDPRGFTLLETVAALAIFALAVTVLTTAYVAGTAARGAVRHDRERAAVIRFISDTVAALPARAVVAGGGGASLPGGPDMRWRVRVSPLHYTGLYAVDIAGEYGNGNALAPILERLELYRPTWATPAEAQTWERQAGARWQKKRER